MEKTKLVSIILPVFNGEKFLSQSIESCLNQTYKNIELIIVNDCSTDNTLEIAKSYADRDFRVSIINNTINKKLPASLNIGHKAAKGDFMTWTSDDNYFEVNAIDEMLSNLKANEVDIVYADYYRIVDGKKNRVSLNNDSLLIFRNVIGACFLYRKNVFLKNLGYDESLFLVEDYDFWLRASKTFKFYKIDRSLYNYRLHNNSLTNSVKNDKKRQKEYEKNLSSCYERFFNSLNLNGKLFGAYLGKVHQSPYNLVTPNEIFYLNEILNSYLKKVNFDKIYKKEIYRELASIQLRMLRNINNKINIKDCFKYIYYSFLYLSTNDFKTWVKLCLKIT